MTQWVFEKLAGAAVRRDPNEAQLFKTEQADEGEYAGTDALVREVLQNSMDAATEDGPVRIRLALHSHKELPAPDRLAHYFDRLRSPLQQREIEFTPAGVPKLEEGFLVCEDFGTRGLRGDPMLSKDPIPDSQHREDFFWFWRNIGRSGKTGDDLGRWGLGKTVYRAASQVGCMLGLTVRDIDQRQLLMGQAVLKIHEFDGFEYVPEGYWCDGVDEHGLPLPIEESDELERFRAEWKLTRSPDQPGLSVVVPYAAPELRGKRILQAICVHFFLPILQKKLVVDLYSPDTREVHLDDQSIMEWSHSITWDGPKRTKRHAPPPLPFVNKCVAAIPKVVPTNVLGETKLPEMNESAFPPDVLSSLRKDFAAEILTCVRVRMALPRKAGKDEIGEVDVFLQRTSDGERVDTYYVREGMTITKLNSQAGRRGVRAFVMVDRGPLASLLGDSEGPAHEDWDTSEERPNRTWTKWKGRVKFCRRIVDELTELLTVKEDKADFDLLSDFFSIEKTQSPQRSRLPKSEGNGKPNWGDIKPTQRWYRLDGRRGGFRVVRSHSTTEVPIPSQLRISVAYDLPSGNPINKWSPIDFEFGKSLELKLTGKNVKATPVSGNVILLDIEDHDFRFGVDGFDENRDLLVRIDELNESPTVEEISP